MAELEEPNQKEIENAIKNAKPATFPDFTKVKEALAARAKANVAHTPRQNGPYIVCVSCGYGHTLGWVGTKKMLVGIDEKGGWILKDRF